MQQVANRFTDEQPVCVACLGVLQKICTESFTKELLDAFPSCGYEFEGYSLTITVPCATIIRQFSLWYYLQSAFGYVFPVLPRATAMK